jgi:hypothetical protein
MTREKSGESTAHALTPPSGPYNPLDRINLARSIEGELLGRDVTPLGDVGAVRGSGIYAIYYAGKAKLYQPTTNTPPDFCRPIYVGKAIPKGSRKGGLSASRGTGNPLRERLRQHAGSIDEAVNIDLADFFVRHLLVDDIWIPLGENVMIERFRPAWNLAVEGFGNKVPGQLRITQKLSPWDVLHPGRGVAEGLGATPVSQEFMIKRVSDFLADRPMDKLPRAVRMRQVIQNAIADSGEDV